MLTHSRQELYRMGILYYGTIREENDSVGCVIQSTQMFFLRPNKPDRRTRGSTWRKLPLCLSLLDLSRDSDITGSLIPSISPKPTIQHRDFSSTITGILQSLPTTSALESTDEVLDTASNLSISFDFFDSGDWTFIGTAPQTAPCSSPSSEPETWILLSDDS